MGKGTLIIGFGKPADDAKDEEGDRATLAFEAFRKALATKDAEAGVDAFRELMSCCGNQSDDSED